MLLFYPYRCNLDVKLAVFFLNKLTTTGVTALATPTTLFENSLFVILFMGRHIMRKKTSRKFVCSFKRKNILRRILHLNCG